MAETVLVQESSGGQYWKKPEDVKPDDVVLHGHQKSRAEAERMVQASRPIGTASVIEDYTRTEGGKPLQKVQISRPAGFKGTQEVTKTEGGYVYTETQGKAPPPEVRISQANIEKSKEIGRQIRGPGRTESIHETAREFDKPPSQISKGVAMGLSSVILGTGETVVGIPTKAVTKARELGDQPGKAFTIAELGRQKTLRETEETIQFAKEEPVAFGVSTAIQLGFMELGLRSLKPIALKTPKVTTSIEIGRQFQIPKGTYTKSAIITRAGTERYVSKVDTFVSVQKTSELSTGISGIETSRGLSSPLEHRIAVSQSLNLGKVEPKLKVTIPERGPPTRSLAGFVASSKGYDLNVGVARIQEIGINKKLVGKPTDIKMVGFSEKLPGRIESISSSIAEKGKPSVMKSIIKTEEPKPPQSMIKFVGGKTETILKPPVETHVQSIAKGLEIQIRAKATPKLTSAKIKPLPISVAPAGQLEKQDLGLTMAGGFKPIERHEKMIRTAIIPETKTNQKAMTRPGQITTPVVREMQIFREDTLSKQIQLQKQIPLQKQMQLMKPVLTTKTTMMTIPKIIPTIIRPPLAIHGRRPFGEIKPIGKKPKGIGLKREFAYTESLTAFELDIRGKGKKPKKGKMFTGFEIRPVFRKK